MNNVTYPPCLVWLPSIKANSYCCTRCGTRLWEADEQTPGLFLENKPLAQDPVGRCKVCGNVVLKIVKEK